MKYTSFFITRQEEKYGMLDENPIYFYGNGAFLYVLKTPGDTLAIHQLHLVTYIALRIKDSYDLKRSYYKIGVSLGTRMSVTEVFKNGLYIVYFDASKLLNHYTRAGSPLYVSLWLFA
jgi:hypothetical protein